MYKKNSHIMYDALLHFPSGKTPKITYDDMKLSFGQPGFSSTSLAFSLLLSDMMDKYNDGGTCYTLHYAITSLCCPDGTPFVDPQIIRSTMTIDGIIMPLLFENYVSEMDVDFMLYLMKVLGHFDSITSSLQVYYNERRLVQPFVRKIYNTDAIFLISCEFQPEVSAPNFQLVSSLKERMQVICNLTNFPYIMQFMGWSAGPLRLCFQLPHATMHLVRKSLRTMPESLIQMKISKVGIEIGSAKFDVVNS